MRFLHSKSFAKGNIARFAQFAVRVWDIEMSSDPELTALKGIKAYREFIKSVGMPANLRELGVLDNRFEEMASRCTGNGTLTQGKFVKLDKQDVINIYTNTQ